MRTRYILAIAIFLTSFLSVATSASTAWASEDEYLTAVGPTKSGFTLAGFDAESSRSMQNEDVAGTFDHDRADTYPGDFDRSRDNLSGSYDREHMKSGDFDRGWDRFGSESSESEE